MSIYPSASRLGIAVPCPASAALPASTTESEAASRGTAIHAFLADYAATPGDRNAAREVALARTQPEYHDACAAIDLAALPPLDPASVLPEVALAFDLESIEGRVLSVNGSRDYSKATSTEVVGTADVLAVGGDALVVLDYKTGYSSQPAACDSWQLRFLALAGCRAYGLKRAVVALVYLRDDLPPAFDRAEFTADDLARFESKLSAAMRAVLEARWEVRAGRVPTTHRGAWCRYCPALATCPAQNAALMAVAQDPGSLAALEAKAAALPKAIAALSETDLALAWERLEVLIPALEAAKSAAKARILQGQVRRADGMVLRAMEQSRDSVVGTLAAQVLTEVCGPEVAAKAVTYEASTTKAAIKKAVPKEKLALVEEAMRRAGAYRKGAPFVVIKSVKAAGEAA